MFDPPVEPSVMNQNLVNAIEQFLKDESGTTAVEYAVMLALIIVVCIGAISSLTSAVDASFSTSATTIANAVGN
jgi:pilus assembly protein Flp/PilA